jgi:signal peptidase
MSNDSFDIEKLLEDDSELLCVLENISAPGFDLSISDSKKVSSLDELLAEFETTQQHCENRSKKHTFCDHLRKKITEENNPADAKGKAGKNKAINMILNIASYVFIIALIAGSTMFAFSNDTNKNIFGYRFYHVLTPSMTGTFNEGDMIFVKIINDPENEVKTGDIVTFQPSPKSTAFLTHRVVELLPADDRSSARMVTKGDANNAQDPPVKLDAVVGVYVFHAPYMGSLIDFMRSNLLLMGICFAATLLLISVLRIYFSTRKQIKGNVSGATSF